MTRPDQATLEALASLQGNANWERVKAWLAENAAKSDVNCRMATDDVVLRQAQGMSQTLHEILDLADTSGDIARKARQNRS